MNERDAKPAPDALGSVEQDRIVMLSDGVFAIAITLLVLDISLPNGVNSSDVSAIVRSLLPHFIGYTISFIVIASYWLGHHRIMKVITHVDRNFLWLNFLFLFFITVFPVSTSLLGLHFGTVAPTIIYACFSAATGFSLWLLWIYASGKSRLLHPRFDPREIRFRSTFYLLRGLGSVGAAAHTDPQKGVSATPQSEETRSIWLIKHPKFSRAFQEHLDAKQFD